MYRLVLIDDEELVLEHLSNCIDYAQLGIEICGTASNGNSGLELICLNNPDIVITDIKMPGLSGIDLLKTLSGFESPPEVIFVSGYSNFEYTKQAIQYGASDYILKPISPDELSQALQKAIVKILKKRKAAKERLELYQSFKDIQTSFEFQSLRSYLTGHSSNAPEISHLLSENLTSYILLTLSVSDEEERASLPEIWSQVTQLVLAPDILVFEDGAIASILLGGQSDEDLHHKAVELAEKIISVLEKNGSLDVSAGISGPCHDREDLPAIFTQSHQVLMQKLFFPAQKVFCQDEFHITEDQFFSKVFSTLLNYMKTADKTSISHYLKTVFQNFHALDSRHIIKSQTEFWCRIILELEHALSSGHTPIISNDLLNRCIRSMNYSKTPNEIFILVERTIYDFVDLINPDHAANTKSVIQTALIYIEENYAQHLTLPKVAQHVYLSSSRFSTLFTEEMKEPFSKYLTNKRIEKAKELMKNPYAKIYEISYAVGFQDARYFSAVFKKATGLTPMEYLKRERF